MSKNKIQNPRDYVLWNSLLDKKLAKAMIHRASLEFVQLDGGNTENLISILAFFELIKENVSYKYGTNIAKVWDKLSEGKQVKLAIEIVGEKEASRFLLMMDCLSEQIQRGRKGRDK